MDEAAGDILNPFDQSWIATQDRYELLVNDNPELSHLIPICTLIRKLKKAGENKKFRLGIAMHDLIISRSHESKLRPGQKYISIKALEKSFAITLRDTSKMYRQYTIKDLDDERLTGLLQTLQQTMIN